MTISQHDQPNNDQTKQRVHFRWHWALLGFGIAIACHYGGYRQLEEVFAVGAVILLTLDYVSTYYVILPRKQVEADTETDTEPEEFPIRFPEPYEDGWHNFTVIPLKSVYEEELCGGDWLNTSHFEYSVKDERVFSRLIDLRANQWGNDHYEVVNGQVLEADIRSRQSFDTTDEYVEGLKRDVTWNEVTGAMRYFILSKHGCPLPLFKREKERLSKAFNAVRECREPAAGSLAANPASHAPTTRSPQTYRRRPEPR